MGSASPGVSGKGTRNNGLRALAADVPEINYISLVVPHIFFEDFGIKPSSVLIGLGKEDVRKKLIDGQHGIPNHFNGVQLQYKIRVLPCSRKIIVSS